MHIFSYGFLRNELLPAQLVTLATLAAIAGYGSYKTDDNVLAERMTSGRRVVREINLV